MATSTASGPGMSIPGLQLVGIEDTMTSNALLHTSNSISCLSSDIELHSHTSQSSPPSAAKPAIAKSQSSTDQPSLLDIGEYRISKAKSMTIIATLAGISFLNTMGSGVLISALPRIASDIGLSEGFLLWPASVYALAAGCLLLVFGAVADVIGAKLVWVTGSFFYVVFTVAVGLSRTGPQMILSRVFLGAAISMCLPSAVSLITNTFPRGTWRNVAFACNGLGQPLGYSVGLILGGIFTDTIGWRWSFFMSAIINVAISVSAIWVLPSVHVISDKIWKRRLIEDIDWIGACVLSAALGILLYVLATTTSLYQEFSNPRNIALLAVSIALLTAFPMWMSFQVRRGKPALIPNKLWRNGAFTATCIAVFFCWASLNAIEYFTTLFQRVLKLSALQSSVRFLPHVIMSASVNIATGFLISRVKVRTLVVGSTLITMVAAPLMATIDLQESYWRAAFWALLLSPVSPDVLFTVSNLVISNAYPADVQSLAGGVFNEVCQFGNSVGLAVTAAIASSVTEHSSAADPTDALLKGYRATFWMIFAATVLVLPVSFFGLSKSGFVGKKDD